MERKLTNKLGTAALCLVMGLGGFGLGKATSKVDKISFHEATNDRGIGGIVRGPDIYRAIKLHKPYAQDEIFVKRKRASDYE
ncbi:hypothetical protein HY837_06870, partial [archaeon]|nr:hypothetical protein [archaeon]